MTSSPASPVAPAEVPGASHRRRRTRVSGEQREQAIITTLRTTLAQRPFAAISVDDLAAGAGLSRPTFYFYFASKEAVLLTLLEQLVAEARAATPTTPEVAPADPAAMWRLAIGTSYGMWTEHRDVIRAAADARSSSPEIRQLWSGLLTFFVDQTAEAIAAEVERGAATPGVAPHDLALCLNRMNERIFEATLDDDQLTLPDERMLDTLAELWLRAIYGTTDVTGGRPPTS